MEQSQQPFKKERKETDDSLFEERGKTDASFSTGRGDTYDNTDEIVSKDCLEADEDRLKKRNSADCVQENESISTSTSDKISSKAESALIDQRKSEDEAIEIERLNMERALKYERREKEELMKTHVSRERQATDKNLLGERVKTDLETERSAELLSTERAELLKTQSANSKRECFFVPAHNLEDCKNTPR